MNNFPEAKEDIKKYTIEGLGGLWLRQKYTDAKLNPKAIRALKGNTLAWFTPEVRAEDNNNEEENL